jgi:hypothetical protein
MDDLLRRRFDRTAVAARLAAMFAALTAAGATVTFPDIGRLVPIARRLRPRVHREVPVVMAR